MQGTRDVYANMEVPPATPQHSDHSGRSAPGGSAVQLPKPLAYANQTTSGTAGKDVGSTTAEPLDVLRNSPLFEGLVQQVQSLMAANSGSVPSFLAFPPPLPMATAGHGGLGAGQDNSGDASGNDSLGLQLTTPTSLPLFASPVQPSLSPVVAQLQGQVQALRAQEGVLRAELDRIAAERDYLDSAAAQQEAELDILRTHLQHAREAVSQYNDLLSAGHALEDTVGQLSAQVHAKDARIAQLLKEKEEGAASQAHLAILARVSIVERSIAERWGASTGEMGVEAAPAPVPAEGGGQAEGGEPRQKAKKARLADHREQEEEEELPPPYSNDVRVDLSPTGLLTAQVSKLQQCVRELQLKLNVSASALRRMREESVARATAAASHHAKVVRELQARHEAEMASLQAQLAEARSAAAAAAAGASAR